MPNDGTKNARSNDLRFYIFCALVVTSSSFFTLFFFLLRHEAIYNENNGIGIVSKENNPLSASLNEFTGGGRAIRNHPPKPEQDTSTGTRTAIMVMAAAPLDKRHVTALWSELDCFTRDRDLDKVLISSPFWSEPMISRIIREAKSKLPHFAGVDPKVRLEARFFENDRYDVGLWCDGWESLKKDADKNNATAPSDDVILLNDSLFALKPFTGILDALRGNYLDPHNSSSSSSKNNPPKRMTSLCYSLTDPQGIWLESVYRAFDRRGMEKFFDHSCHPAGHESFCPLETDSRKKKKCITDNHEVAIARLFDSTTEIQGLYPADVPKEQWKELKPFGTWASHKEYWRDVLVDRHDFPAAKVSKRNMIRTMKDPLIQECTARFNRSIFVDEADIFDFTRGSRTIARNT